MNREQILEIIEQIKQNGHTKLSLSWRNLVTLPPEIGQLTNLVYLDLRANQLTKLPESICYLTNLQFLDLRSNELAYLPWSIGKLSNLTILKVDNNQIKELPESIGKLVSLSTLSVNSNRLQELPESIANLTNISSINAYENDIKKLPKEICKLTNISHLNLGSNRLKELPESIGELTKLSFLNLGDNQLESLPESITKLSNLRILDIHRNKLHGIPPEVIAKGGLAVRDYLRQRIDSETDYIFEAKLLIVGEGGAGKTSLAKKLNNPEYKLKVEGSSSPEKATEGIEVYRIKFLHASGNVFRINLWDFGGQEIYHATHQFFLTKRSLYCLVADTRQENTDFNYWLEVTEILSGASPIIIVKNEKQDRTCQVNEGQLRGRFFHLKEVLSSNLATNRGLRLIAHAVKHYITQLPHIGDPLPRTWVWLSPLCLGHSFSKNVLDRLT